MAVRTVGKVETLHHTQQDTAQGSYPTLQSCCCSLGWQRVNPGFKSCQSLPKLFCSFICFQPCPCSLLVPFPWEKGISFACFPLRYLQLCLSTKLCLPTVTDTEQKLSIQLPQDIKKVIFKPKTSGRAQLSSSSPCSHASVANIPQHQAPMRQVFPLTLIQEKVVALGKHPVVTHNT